MGEGSQGAFERMGEWPNYIPISIKTSKNLFLQSRTFMLKEIADCIIPWLEAERQGCVLGEGTKGQKGKEGRGKGTKGQKGKSKGTKGPEGWSLRFICINSKERILHGRPLSKLRMFAKLKSCAVKCLGRYFMLLQSTIVPRIEYPFNVNVINQLKPSMESRSLNAVNCALHTASLAVTTSSVCYSHVGFPLLALHACLCFQRKW